MEDSSKPSVNNSLYTAPFFIAENQEIVGLSHLFYVKVLTMEDTVLLKGMAAQNQVEILGNNPLRPLWFTLACSNQSVGNALDMSNTFYESGLFAYAEPDIMVSNMVCSSSNTTPCVNDTLFPAQWNLQNTGQNNGVEGVDIDYCMARQLTQGSQDIIVAVIDRGVDLTHPDLNNIHPFSYDAMSLSSPSVIYGEHGTECAGIIGASADNGIGVAGVAPGCPIMSISHNLFVSPDNAQKFANAIHQAWTNGASVINNSWCSNNLPTSQINDAIEDAVTYGRDGKGCVVVFASGNNNYSSVEYPASNPNVISVGAVDRCGIRSGRVDSGSGSCEFWGGFTTAVGSSYGNGLCVVAPGTHIPTADLYNSILHTYYSEYNNGTSFACPHVSGIAALMLSVNPDLTYTEVRDIIEQTTQKVGGYSYNTDTIHTNGTWNNEVGYGLVNAHKAVTVAKLHHADFAITGSQNINVCQDYTYNLIGTVPDNFEIVWGTSPNMYIASGQGTHSVTVRALYPSTQNSVTVKICFMGAVGKTVTLDNIISTGQGHIPLCNVDTMFVQNMIMSGNFSLGTVVSIDSGITLSLTGTLYCAPSARIVVHPGGKLVVDGGTLTSACAGEMWQGVMVLGDRTQHQTASKQGTVVLKNGAVVENARCGIKTGLPTFPDSLIVDINTTGGIISAENTTFRNCAKAVAFFAYIDTFSNGTIRDYLGSFTNCTFTVDDNNLFSANNTAFSDHVSLWGVKGVKFHGCTFNNLTSNQNDRRHAINAHSAGFVADVYCNGYEPSPSDCGCPAGLSDSCVFVGFSTAIEANTDGAPYAVTVNRAQFANNGTAVRINADNFATVTECDFNLTECDVETVNQVYGLYLDNCTGYLVEGNAFYRETYPTSPLFPDNRNGIYVKASGSSANSIYQNDFTNLTRGVFVSGSNGGLQIGCCSFLGNSYDISIPQGASIAMNQGSLSAGADNTFNNTRVSSIQNAGGQKLTYYYSAGNNHAPYNPIFVSLNSRATANSCASTLCGYQGPQPLVDLTSFSSLFSTVPSLLATEPPTTIDGIAATEPPTTDDASAIYHTAVRTLMADSLLDMAALEQWHAAAQPIADPYSLTETRFSMGYDETFAYNTPTIPSPTATEPPIATDELSDYTEFHNLKRALRGFDSQINWYAITPAQIAQLQDFAEAGTGRASVMARGVLCFFFGICYDDEDVMAETRRGTAKDGEGYMPVLTDDTVTFSIASLLTLFITDYDPYYLGAQSFPYSGCPSDTVVYNNKKYRMFPTPLSYSLYIREDTSTGRIFRYYPDSDIEVMTCDMSLQEGDTFYLPLTPVFWYWELEQEYVVVDSVTYSNGRKTIWFPPIEIGSGEGFFSIEGHTYPLCFIEGVGPTYGPFGYVVVSLENWLSLLLCVHHNDSFIYMTDPVLGCEQLVTSVPEYPDVSMKLYPNPAGNTLHVAFEGTDNPQGTLTVTNITGVVVLTRECNAPLTQLDVSNLTPGLYVISFRNGNGVVVRKFVKL